MRLLQWVGVCALGAGLMLATGTAAWAQSGSASDDGSNSGGYGSGGYNAGQGGYGGAQGGSSGTGHLGSNIGGSDTPQTQLQMEQQQVKSRNMERQKQLVSDTQKLVALSNELKADVDKSTKDTLSLDVVRKADEIEKLAHNVKERMKNAN